MRIDGRLLPVREFKDGEKTGKGNMMKWRRQGKTGEAFARRVLVEVSLRERQREKARHVQDMLDALQELTGVAKAELETIAMKVGDSPVHDRDTFFSLRHQAILASAFLGMILFLPALCLWMVC